MKKTTLDQFKTDCLQVIKHYQTDLDFDLDLIADKKPLICFAYECGSHCVELRDFNQYPNKFERVPFLFGTADREHILDQVGCTLECESIRNASLVHYFDGQTIYRIDHKKAHDLIRDYKHKMRTMFDRFNGLVREIAA